MKILLLSDISWGRISLDYAKRKVLSIDPSLVVLAGDLVDNDKSVDGNMEAWSSLYAFVNFLAENETQTFFIRGNWDRAPYDELVAQTRQLARVEEISGKIREFNGIRLLGVPYSLTNHLGTAKRLGERFPAPVDIVVAHAELSRRIWLFGLSTKFVVTGHFDGQLCQIRDKVFVSLEGFPHGYAILDYEQSQQTVTYVERGFACTSPDGLAQEGEARVSRVTSVGERLIWETAPLKSSVASGKYRDYDVWVERLLEAREAVNEGKQEFSEAMQSLLQSGIPKKHVREYLGSAASL